MLNMLMGRREFLEKNPLIGILNTLEKHFQSRVRIIKQQLDFKIFLVHVVYIIYYLAANIDQKKKKPTELHFYNYARRIILHNN